MALPWLSSIVSTVTGGLLDSVFGHKTETASSAPQFVTVPVQQAAAPPVQTVPVQQAAQSGSIPTWALVGMGAAMLLLVGVALWRR